MAQLEFLNVEKNLNSTLQLCMDAVEKWLKEQELALSESKKNKLSLLLARYFCEQGTFTEKDVLVLLRNLGGGHFDEEDHESVEIEIQRLLGHTTPVSAIRNSLFMRGAIVAALAIFFVISGSLVSIAIDRAQMSNAVVNHDYTYATPEQVGELRSIVDKIKALESEFGLAPTSFEESLVIVGEPLNITRPERIPEESYLTLKRHYGNVLGYFKKQKSMRAERDLAAAQNTN